MLQIGLKIPTPFCRKLGMLYQMGRFVSTSLIIQGNPLRAQCIPGEAQEIEVEGLQKGATKNQPWNILEIKVIELAPNVQSYWPLSQRISQISRLDWQGCDGL